MGGGGGNGLGPEMEEASMWSWLRRLLYGTTLPTIPKREVPSRLGYTNHKKVEVLPGDRTKGFR